MKLKDIINENWDYVDDYYRVVDEIKHMMENIIKTKNDMPSEEKKIIKSAYNIIKNITN